MELFIDSSRETLSLALVDDNKLIFKSNVNSHNKHSNYLIGEIKNNLSLNNISLNDIDSFITLNGPGSFTGVRVGVTVSKVFSWILNKNLYLLNNLEALKVGFDDEVIITVVPDKKDYSYVGIYQDTNLYEGYMSLNDNNLNLVNKKITIISLSNNDFLNSLFTNLSVNNKINLRLIEDYNYINLINYALTKEKVNTHLAKPIYLKKIDVEK